VNGEEFAKEFSMRTVFVILLWFLLLAICWPLALLAIFILPFVWLILLPFRVVGLTIDLIFKVISAILLFPFRLVK